MEVGQQASASCCLDSSHFRPLLARTTFLMGLSSSFATGIENSNPALFKRYVARMRWRNATTIGFWERDLRTSWASVSALPPIQ
jgi:hypothetical protein